MDSITRLSLIHTLPCTQFNPKTTPNFKSRDRLNFRVSSSYNHEFEKNGLVQKLQTTSKVFIFTAATAIMLGKFSQLPAKAESPLTTSTVTEEEEEVKNEESPLTEFLESHSEAIDALKSLLERKLEDGEDEEALKILKRLISAQPLELAWKFLMARLYNEMGEKDGARKVYEDILLQDPLCFDALFQNAVLMDQCGEGQAALRLLEEKLLLAQQEHKENDARNVRLIMAQIQYLQKNVDEALSSYQELAKEDPQDYRPYFYQFVIYSLLDRNEEAKAQFAKCREVCPKDFKVEGFVQTPLSRVKLFGSGLDN